MEETMQFSKTAMAQALVTSDQNPTFRTHARFALESGGYSYGIESRNGQTVYTVSNGEQAISLPIQWTMGQKMQTFILERDGHYYQSRVSYYPLIKGLAITIGDEKLNSRNLDEAVGRQLKSSELRDCFYCHSTNSEINGRLTLSALHPGVTCEHCHQAADAHLTDAMHGNFASVPPDLRKLSSQDTANFCGGCHRTWETVVRNGIRGEANVRFQPYRLENSKCFDGSDSRITCTACHDPHEELERSTSAYDAKCLACHGSKQSRVSTSSSAVASICPVAKSDCVTCHMPKTKVRSPAGLLTFTDHFIRIVKEGEGYPD